MRPFRGSRCGLGRTTIVVARSLAWVVLTIGGTAACRPNPRALPRTLPLRLIEGTSYSSCQSSQSAAQRPRFTTVETVDCRLAPTAAETARYRRSLMGGHFDDPIGRAVVETWLTRDDKTLQRLSTALAKSSAAEEPRGLMARAGVAHALALATGSPMPAIEALDLLERARGAALGADNPAPATLAFDRGIVLADLGLCHLASQAFALAVSQEPDDGWRREADERAAALPCRTAIAPGSTLDGELDEALDRVLPELAAAIGRPGQRALWERISAIGTKLAKVGEPLVSDVARELGDERLLADSSFRQAIVNATAARTAFLALDYDSSRRLFEHSCGDLDRRGSALAGWCQYWFLATRIYYGELKVVRAPLAQLRATVTSPYLRGRTAWSEGLAASRQGDYAAAYDLHAIAAANFSSVRLGRSQAAAQVLRAETLADLGAWEQAGRVRNDALLRLQREEPHFALLNGLIDGANDAHRLGFDRAADPYLAEAALLARKRGNVVTQTEIHLLHGELQLSARGSRARNEVRRTAARGQFSAARALAATLDGQQARERNAALAELGLAEAGEETYNAPVALLSLADYFARKGPPSSELRALALLVETAESIGNAPLATRAYARARTLIAAQRSDIHGVVLDARFLASQRAFFDRMIASALRQGDARRALALVADASPGPAAARGWASFERAEEQRVLLVYRFLDGELVWWSVSDGTLRQGLIPDAELVRTLVEELRARRGRPTEAQLEEGYRRLLSAPLAGVPRGRPLILVLDADLAVVPFAALRESGSGVRLIEQHPVSLAMSPYSLPDDRIAAAEPHPVRATVVGDPAFDHARLPWLDRLRGARAEASGIAHIYGPDADVLLGKAATAGAVRLSARRAEVLHVAAHALAGKSGEGVALVLAADSASGLSGVSTVEELAPPGNTPRLVVLSACATLDARGSDGLIGLAGPFLASGAAAVVGTLWPVDDRRVGPWMVELHRQIASGTRVSVALQRVQARAAATEPCCDWAALAVVGDVALPVRSASADTASTN